jgi:hypothetical protein
MYLSMHICTHTHTHIHTRTKYDVVYDDGEVVSGVGKGGIKDSSQQPQRRVDRRTMGFIFGRVSGEIQADDAGWFV